MYQSKKIVCIILARGGSKGIPGKNIKDCAGKPLIAWTLEASAQSRYLDRTIVSSDSPKIRQIVKDWQGEAPFERPSETAQDTSGVDGALVHALKWVEDNDPEPYTYVVYLQPTSPLRNSALIDEAIEYYFSNRKSESDAMISAQRLDNKYSAIMKQNADGYSEFLLDISKTNHRRQDAKELCLPNGAFYISPISTFTGSFYHDKTMVFLMDKESSLDIDNVEEFHLAEKILKEVSQ